MSEDNGALLRGMAEGHKLRAWFLTGLRPSRRQDAAGMIEELRATAPKGESTRLGGGVRAVLDELRGTALAAIVRA